MHATGYTVIGIKDWLRPRPVRKLLLAGSIAALLPMVGHGQSLHERIQADEAKDAANEIIRKERALRNMPQGPDNSGNRPERSGPSAHQVWQEKENARIDRANRAKAFNTQAHAAWQRKDYREALRLFRAQQQVIDGPNIREAIAQTEAQIAWSEATTAAELRRAIAMQPGFFTQENIRYVGEVEAQEKRGEIARQRQQLDRAIGGDILLRINSLALSLDAEPAANLEFALVDPRVVDARQVPTGLPPAVEAAIPATPAGDRVRKGFQAITDHDWKVARAWFQDALNHEPGNPGLQRLVDLANFTLDYHGPASAPAAPALIPARSAEAIIEDSPGVGSLPRVVAQSITARGRVDALYKSGKDIGRPGTRKRSDAIADAMNGVGYSKEELEAQFQEALSDYLKHKSTAASVGGSPVAEEIILGGKG